MLRKIGIAAIAALLSTTAAHAVDGTLVGLGGSDTVFVWRDVDAHSEAISLIEAGVHQSNPALLMALLSCVVDSGTRVITTDVGFATHDIMVIEGENSGCRGNVAAETFKRQD